jgi:hypothetical protein
MKTIHTLCAAAVLCFAAYGIIAQKTKSVIHAPPAAVKSTPVIWEHFNPAYPNEGTQILRQDNAIIIDYYYDVQESIDVPSRRELARHTVIHADTSEELDETEAYFTAQAEDIGRWSGMYQTAYGSIVAKYFSVNGYGSRFTIPAGFDLHSLDDIDTKADLLLATCSAREK